MAAPLDIYRKQSAVTEFLVLEGENAPNIHRRLGNVYGNATLDANTVRKQASRVNSNVKKKNKTDFSDKLVAAAVNEVDALITEETRLQISVKAFK